MIPTTSSPTNVSRHYASRRGSFVSGLFATCVALIALSGVFTSAAAQTSSPSPIPAPIAQSVKQTPKRVVGYLQGSEPNFLLLLPPYPVLDSPQDAVDVATFRQMQVADQTPRWKLAQADAQMTYARFTEPLGISLDPAKLPIVMHLISRMERDVLDSAFEAKDDFNRPRPYQRLAVTHVCGTNVPPQPEAHPTKGSSYPSGHMAFGWGIALTLAEITPDNSQAILVRGREYGESRVVCAVHYPSDVAAGQLIATAVVERLHSVPEFTRDMVCAKQEYAAAVRSDGRVVGECRSLETELKLEYLQPKQ
jgi:acid phosphatase (class A)